MADWKKIYGPDWPSGKRKVQKVIDALGAHDIKAEAHGFMPLSTEYTPENPLEKGAPDLKIVSVEIYVEVTGPNIPMSPQVGLWIRWDKFKYAEDHPEKEIWVAHILESENDLIRFLKLGSGVKERYEEIHPTPRQVIETYRTVPANDPHLFSLAQFCDYIKTH
jgi:hypothetical protein